MARTQLCADQPPGAPVRDDHTIADGLPFVRKSRTIQKSDISYRNNYQDKAHEDSRDGGKSACLKA